MLWLPTCVWVGSNMPNVVPFIASTLTCGSFICFVSGCHAEMPCTLQQMIFFKLYCNNFNSHSPPFNRQKKQKCQNNCWQCAMPVFPLKFLLCVNVDQL